VNGQLWARLQGDTNLQLRRGAWYRVSRLGAREAVLDVHQTALTVPRALLQISSTRPSRWSVVGKPQLAGVSRESGDYAVCPNCRNRATLVGHPANIRCPRCNGLFEVDWGASKTAQA
jgi:hypothetical protein